MQTKKVLGIVGSPRTGGNTDKLVEIILKSASENGAVTEKVYLKNLKIENCRECLTCHTGSKKECVIKDDMPLLIERMQSADVWVLGTPLFWWGPSGYFKTFIDRWFGYDLDWKNKRIIFTYPSGDPNIAEARHLRGMFESILSYLDTKAFAYVQAAGANDPGDIEKLPKVAEYAREVGRTCIL